MGERKMDITDDSRGVLGNRIVGHMYIDDTSNEITITDDSRGPLGNHIVGHGYIENSGTSASGLGVGEMHPLLLWFVGIALLGFIIAIPYSWYFLLTHCVEYPLECLMLLGLAVATTYIAYKYDPKTAMASSVVFGTVIFLLTNWQALETIGDSLVFFIGSALFFGGFSVIPVGVSRVIKDIKGKI